MCFLRKISKITSQFTQTLLWDKVTMLGRIVCSESADEPVIGSYSEPPANEIQILKRIRTEGTVSLKGHADDHTCVLLEYMPNDTFLKILKKGPLVISQARTVTKYLASEIAHCDIKPENILVAQNYSLKLCDFGFSRISSQEQGAPGGTPGYTAPEMYFQPMLNLKKCDIFALGVVIFIVVMGFPPFQNNDPQTRDTWWNLILTKQWDVFWLKCENFRQTKYPNDFKHVIMNMLECDFNKRLSLEDLLKSEFVSGESSSDEEVLMEIKKRI